MQSEIEYLTEVSRVIEAIGRTKDRQRKHAMKRHLHGRLYKQMHQYAFASIVEVRRSVDYLNAGKQDPTRKPRYERLRKTIDTMSRILSDYDNERSPETSQFTLSLRYTEYKRKSDHKAPDKENPLRDRKTDIDLDLD
jgi:hypothetical protein